MRPLKKVLAVSRGIIQVHGGKLLKKWMWDHDFRTGRYGTTPSAGDFLYPYLEKYARNGSILDLGCGAGNTGEELNWDAYHDYTGVDLSDVAIRRAADRSQVSGRAAKNRYIQDDILTHIPSKVFDVILFRDSIYYVEPARVRDLIERYDKHLKSGGVFIVRVCEGSSRFQWVFDMLEQHFEVLERSVIEEPMNAIITVFRVRLSRTKPAEDNAVRGFQKHESSQCGR